MSDTHECTMHEACGLAGECIVAPPQKRGATPCMIPEGEVPSVVKYGVNPGIAEGMFAMGHIVRLPNLYMDPGPYPVTNKNEQPYISFESDSKNLYCACSSLEDHMAYVNCIVLFEVRPMSTIDRFVVVATIVSKFRD